MFIPDFCLYAPNTGSNYDARIYRASGKRHIKKYGSWIFGIVLLVLCPASREHWGYFQIRFKWHQRLPILPTVGERCGNYLF